MTGSTKKIKSTESSHHHDENSSSRHNALHSLSSLLPSFLRKDKHHEDKAQEANKEVKRVTIVAPEPQQQQQQQPIARPAAVPLPAPTASTSSSASLLPAAAAPTQVEHIDADRWIVKGDPWQVPTRFTLHNYLGGGSYGSVARATDTKTGKQVAVKKIISPFKGQTHALRVLREIAILRRLNHPYIVRLVDVVDPPPPCPSRIKELYVVLDYGGTDLQQLAKMNLTLNMSQIRFVMKQLLLGCAYMHDAQVIHRDLKPANILINPETLEIKLADFGLARVLLPGKRSARIRDDPESASGPACRNDDHPVSLKRVYTEHVVTRWYRAPEVILSHGLYSTAIDVWSVGCIFAELLGLQNPQGKRRPIFPGRSCFPLSPTQRDDCYRDQRDQLNVIFNVIGTPDHQAIMSLDATEDVVTYLESLPKLSPCDLSELYPLADKQALEILFALLHFDATRRMSVNQCLTHPFMRESEPKMAQPASVANAMLRMDIEHKADKRDMIKSLEGILRNEIARMHSTEPECTLGETHDEECPPQFVRVFSSSLPAEPNTISV